MRRLTLVTCLVLFVALAPAAGSADCATAQFDCLPTAEECAAGEANGVWLGKYLGAAGVCVGSGGNTIAYAAGNPTYPCGVIIVANQVVQEGDARVCDEDVTFPSEPRYRVQLPADYATSDRRYPVLYLLPGGGWDENVWFDIADLASLANRGVIIVVPYNGVSFFVDWRDGSIKAESTYIRSLLPHIDQTYRTIADRGHRAVAGFSQGGGGALLWSARHPDLFGVAASFSGLADFSLTDPFGDIPFDAEMRTLATYRDPVRPNPVFGDPLTDAVWWHNINPADMAASLKPVDLWISVGNGVPTQEEADPISLPFQMRGEIDLLARNLSFRRALDAAGVEYDFRTHAGTHSIVTAVRDLLDWFPLMLERFGAADPTSFDYRTVESSFSVWGWQVQTDPARAPEFLDMRNASAAGATFIGSGLTTVTSARYFAPGQAVGLLGATTSSAIADQNGAITFAVDLGVPHQAQQYTVPALIAETAGGYFQTREVRFSAT